MRYFIYLIGLSFLLLTVHSGEAEALDTGPEIGKIAPAFELPDLNGKKIAFSEFKAKVILLNFWETACGPCKAEMPSLQALYDSLKDKGFVALAVSVDRSEKDVRTFVSRRNITFPVLMDKDRNVFFDDYAVFGLPTTFLIDRKGVVVAKIIGAQEWDSPEIKSRITGLLNAK